MGAPAPSFLPSPGITYDGVDPAFSDTPTAGEVFSIATSSGRRIYHVPSVTFLGSAPRTFGNRPAAHRRRPQAGAGVRDYIVQPTTSGLLRGRGIRTQRLLARHAGEWSRGRRTVDGFHGGVHAVRTSAAAPGALTYRGGDAQPTFFSPGPVEPAGSVDNPDQDFVTKCLGVGVCDEPSAVLVLCSTTPNTTQIIFFRTAKCSGHPRWLGLGHAKPGQGVPAREKRIVARFSTTRVALMYQFRRPRRAIGGSTWDWDNKTCKVRRHGQIEPIINLTPLGYGMPPISTTATYGAIRAGYPIVDRMNGREFVASAGADSVGVRPPQQRPRDDVHPAGASHLAAGVRRQRKTLVIPLREPHALLLQRARLSRLILPLNHITTLAECSLGQLFRVRCSISKPLHGGRKLRTRQIVKTLYNGQRPGAAT